MFDSINKEERDTIQLELPIGVPLARLIEAEDAFRDLIGEVGRSVLEATRGEPINWIVTDVEKSSVRFVVQARPANGKVASNRMPEVLGTITSGLESLASRAERPAHFNDRALEKTKKLCGMSGQDFPIAIHNGQASVELTTQIVANIDKLIGASIRSIGRVEGTLERLNIHDKRAFSIYDRLTGVGIECNFGQRIQLSDITAAVGRRVAVYGEIRYSHSGDIVSVAAERLEVFPPSDELPTAYVRGILG